MMIKRKPNRFEMTFLMLFHGVLTAGILLTYITGDDAYFLHQFAGYVVCGVLLLRLFVSLSLQKIVRFIYLCQNFLTVTKKAAALFMRGWPWP